MPQDLATNKIVVILPNIRSGHNVGAFFRTADAIGVSKMYLVGWTPEPGQIQVDKVSLGAEKVIPWERYSTLAPLIKKLKAENFTIVGMEKTKSSTDYRDWKPQFPLAIIVGSEVDGMSCSALRHCDTIVHLPMLGHKKSLNVSVAFGALAYYLLLHNIGGN